MTVVTLEGLLPIPRYDTKSWTTAAIYEGPTKVGPWLLLETKVLTADLDPRYPQVRNLTTELAVLPDGWYFVVFGDLTGDLQLPTVPLKNDRPPELANYMPTVNMVGAEIRARTKNKDGIELGTFNADTRPTAIGAIELIHLAAGEVLSVVDYDVPEDAWEFVRSAISLAAAMKVELSYFPEQVNIGRSPYTAMERRFEAIMLRLTEAVDREESEDGQPPYGPNMPIGNFPPATDWLTRRM